MKLFSLDKKYIRLQHQFSVDEWNQLMIKFSLNNEDLVKEVQKQLYLKFIAGTADALPTSVLNEAETKTLTVSGYVLSEKDMDNLLLEVLTLNEDDRENMIKQLKHSLGITQ